MNRLILIQHIGIWWGKEDRGAQAGAARNALPRRFAFAPPGPGGRGWIHSIRMDARDAYAPGDKWCEFSAANSGGIRVEPAGAFAEVSIGGGGVPLHVQKPKRPNLNGLIARLPFGQRLVLRVNTAIDGHHQRWYADHTVHIGFAEAATLDLPLFREIDERADLY